MKLQIVYEEEKNIIFFLSETVIVTQILQQDVNNVKQSHYRPGEALRVPGG